MLINVKMPTIVGILTFMSMINFELIRVWHGKSFMTSSLLLSVKLSIFDHNGIILYYFKTNYSVFFIFLLFLKRLDLYITMNIFRKKNLFKSFVKIDLSYVFTKNMFRTAESCMEQ